MDLACGLAFELSQPIYHLSFKREARLDEFSMAMTATLIA